MLKIIRMILSIIVMVLGIYGLTTNNFALLPYMMGLLGVLSITWGITEIRNNRKSSGVFCLLAAAFVFFVDIKTTLFG